MHLTVFTPTLDPYSRYLCRQQDEREAEAIYEITYRYSLRSRPQNLGIHMVPEIRLRLRAHVLVVGYIINSSHWAQPVKEGRLRSHALPDS